MSARSEVDKRNLLEIKAITDRYPSILKKYIDSLSRKTSYTKLAYCRYISRFMDYMSSELKYSMRRETNYNKIKPMDIDGYMEFIKNDENNKEKSPMYRAAQLAALKGFFKFLYNNEIISKNPCQNTEVPKEDKEHNIVTIDKDDLNIMITNIDNGVGNIKSRSTQAKWKSRDKALLMLGVTTGLRISAICGIDINDIDFDNKTIKVIEKGDKERYIYIGDNTIKYLMKWIIDRKNMNIKDDNALFICQSGKRISVDTVQRRFRQISQGTNKKITPHKMRATCATKLYDQTKDIYLVQQQLGHKNIENTKRYTRVSEDRRREAANILDSLY